MHHDFFKLPESLLFKLADPFNGDAEFLCQHCQADGLVFAFVIFMQPAGFNDSAASVIQLGDCCRKPFPLQLAPVFKFNCR